MTAVLSRQGLELVLSFEVRRIASSSGCFVVELTLALGWDEGVLEMSLGEKSILTISGYDLSLTCIHMVWPNETSVGVLTGHLLIHVFGGSDYAYGDR